MDPHQEKINGRPTLRTPRSFSQLHHFFNSTLILTVAADRLTKRGFNASPAHDFKLFRRYLSTGDNSE